MLRKVQAQDADSQSNKALNIRMIGLATFASMATTRICDSMLVTLAQDLGSTAGRTSAVVSWYAIAYCVMQLFYGPIGDRVGKLRVVMMACLACGFFTVLAALAPSLDWLIFSRVAMGVFSAAIIPLSMAWIGDNVVSEHQQATLAKLSGWTVSGMMFGVWFGGFAADHLHWRTAFVALAAALLVAGWTIRRRASLLMQTTAPRHATGSVAQTLSKLGGTRAVLILALSLFEGIALMGAVTFIPARLVQHFGLSATMAGTVMLLFGLGGLAYSKMASFWLRLIGPSGLALLGGCLIGAGFFGLSLADLPLIGILASTVAGLGFYMIHGNLQTQATQMAPTARGTALSFFSCMVFLGQSFGVMLMAASFDNGLLSEAFAIAGALILLLGWLVALAVRRA